MKILWMTWKDRTHPLAGGAEVVNEELAKRAIADGHEVTFLVGGYENSKYEETHKDGYKIVRLGNRFTVYWKAYRYYKKNLVGWADLVIDEVNTVPFFAKFYVKERNMLFVHQLCRQIWFYQMVFPLSLIGYLIEPIYLRMLSDKKVITVSNSTKKDLMRHGFKAENIDIISEGIEIQPLEELPPLSSKFSKPTVLSLGSIRPMKRTMDQLKAFEIAKDEIKDLQLIIAGDASDKYGKRFLRAVKKSKYSNDIFYKGKVSLSEKIKLLKKSHLLMQTSIKEGWGLTVTEAASQGTPSVVYDVDGLRDSVMNSKTGIIAAQNTPGGLAAEINQVLKSHPNSDSMRENSLLMSKQINFEKSYDLFGKVVAA